MKSVLIIKLGLLIFLQSCANSGNGNNSLEDYIANKAIDIENASDLDRLIAEAGDKKLVLLGEASHGTHEYYAWRDSISRRLISEHNFDFIVVEGDFASLYEINKYVKGLPGAAESAEDALLNLDRWPLWMWGNKEIVNLVEWLHDFNKELPENEKVGFYGMDVYDEWRSKKALIGFLKEKSPELHKLVKEKYGCFSPYLEDSWLYARDVRGGSVDCSGITVEVINLLIDNKSKMENISDYDFFYALQNAYVIKNAERFYRKSVVGQRHEGWNARATHMYETAKRLRELYGENSKGIVWAHNTHIGDAYHTDMRYRDEVNIGQLSRKYFEPENVFLVGFVTYKGTVMAGLQWGGQRQIMEVPKAQTASVEDFLNRTGKESFYLIFDEEDRNHPQFMRSLGNRAIGVSYNPRYDFRQFVHTIVPMRYDALIFFHETKALSPLHD